MVNTKPPAAVFALAGILRSWRWICSPGPGTPTNNLTKGEQDMKKMITSALRPKLIGFAIMGTLALIVAAAVGMVSQDYRQAHAQDDRCAESVAFTDLVPEDPAESGGVRRTGGADLARAGRGDRW